MLKRSTHLLARSLAALLAIVTILLALLVWRLASGPVSLKFLDSYLAAFLSEAPKPTGDIRLIVIRR